MQQLPSFETAIKLLKNAVKYSNIENQKHIDLTLVNASDRIKYQMALVVVQNAVATGSKTQTEVNELLGLK